MWQKNCLELYANIYKFLVADFKNLTGIQEIAAALGPMIY